MVHTDNQGELEKSPACGQTSMKKHTVHMDSRGVLPDTMGKVMGNLEGTLGKMTAAKGLQ